MQTPVCSRRLYLVSNNKYQNKSDVMKAAARSYIVKDVDVVIQHPMNDVRQQINILIINDI